MAVYAARLAIYCVASSWEPTKLPYAIRLSRKAGRTIRFNIAVAIGLKVVLGVGAVAGLVSLATAVLVGDMGGSLAVTLNALRLAATKER